MGWKQWELSCPCCQPPCGCFLTCGQIPMNFPKTDLILTLIGSGSSEPSTCYQPGPDNSGCLSALDMPVTLTVPMSWGGEGFPKYSYGLSSNFLLIDPANPGTSGYLLITCFGKVLELEFATNYHTAISAWTYNFNTQPIPTNTIPFYSSEFGEPLTLPAYCPEGCNNQGYPLRVYTEAHLSLVPARTQGYCVDVGVFYCDFDTRVTGQFITSINGAIAQVGVDGAKVTLTAVSGHKTISGTTNANGFVTLDIGGPGLFNVDIESQIGTGGTSGYNFTCGTTYRYLYPPCYYKPLSAGYTWKFNYSCGSIAASYNCQAGYPACFVSSCGYANCNCGAFYCPDCDALCQYLNSNPQNFTSCYGIGPQMYEVLYPVKTASSLDFTITKDSPFISETGFVSEIKLVYAAVFYTSKDAQNPCARINFNTCFDVAHVQFGYACIVANDFVPLSQHGAFGCGAPSYGIFFAINSTLQPPNAGTNGTYCGVCNGQPIYTSYPYCGPNALSDAQQFCSNLPDTAQWDDSWGLLGPGEGFNTILGNPFQLNPPPIDPIITCNGVTQSNYHQVLGCPSTPLCFDGYNTLSWSV